MRAAPSIIGLVATLIASLAIATPDAATWRRQTLVGENAEYFFRYVTTRENPASYYSYRLTLRLEKVRKSDLRVVEQFPLSDMYCSQDLKTDIWGDQSEKVPPFDMSGYLRKNAVNLAFADDLFDSRTFDIDSSGVWEIFDDGRIHLADWRELLRQIPNLGEEPRVAGIEGTGLQPSKRGKSYLYLRIWSNSAAIDSDWSEDLLLVDGNVLR